MGMGESGFGTSFLGVLVAAAAAWFVGVGWATSWLLVSVGADSGFRPARDNVLVATWQMLTTPGRASEAWGMSVTAFVFWFAFGCVVGASLVVLGLVSKLMTRKGWGLVRRVRLGSETEVRMARARDLETLWSKFGPQQRLLLGRTFRSGWSSRSRVLATESASSRNGLSRRARKRANDRGAVCVMGPSRSGKTVNVLAGVLSWDGPVLLSSVKDDLLDPTLAHRRRQGEVAVFDPTSVLRNAYEQGKDVPAGWDDRLVGPWSPLRASGTYEGARRAARSIADAGPERASSGDGQNAMWVELAEQLLSGLLFAAATGGRDMGDVCLWVMQQDKPTAEALGEVKQLLLRALEDPMFAVDAQLANAALESVWSKDPKIVGSVYVTANTLVAPWLAQEVRSSSQGRSIDLDWLIGGNNSLYLVAPPQDAKRLSSLFGGVVNDLIEQAFVRAMAHGPLDPPLLVVLDEAANLPLARLPEFASLVAGLGIQLVTVWQSVAQIDELYGRSMGTVIANHLTKVVFPGQSDADTLKTFSELGGEEEVLTRIDTGEKLTLFKGSVQHQGTRLSVIPANVIRMMESGDSLLIHGTLYPAHVRAIPWYEQRRFRRLQGWNPARDGDASAFYARMPAVGLAPCGGPPVVIEGPDVIEVGDAAQLALPDRCAGLVFTSPPYHVGKAYDTEVSFSDYLEGLSAAFAESFRVLEHGGRILVNSAGFGSSVIGRRRWPGAPGFLRSIR